MDLFEAMQNRRSVRKYTDQPVPDELLDRVLEAARLAPSWVNTQCWRLIVIRDQSIKEQIAQATPKVNPSRKALTQAPVLIAACAEKGLSGCYDGSPATSLGDWYMFDLALAIGQLTLAAHALGLGTVHVGLLDLDQVSEILELPENFQFVEVLPLGYPAKSSKMPRRREVSEFTRFDRWS